MKCARDVGAPLGLVEPADTANDVEVGFMKFVDGPEVLDVAVLLLPASSDDCGPLDVDVVVAARSCRALRDANISW